MTLAELRARLRPVLLLFVDAGCGACDALMVDADRWESEHGDALTVVRIVAGGPASAEGKGWRPGKHLLVQDGFEVAGRFGVHQVPSALIVGAGGDVASPLAAGPDAIRTLVLEVVGRDTNGTGVAPRSRTSMGRG